jgi:hypothetical protein
VEFRCASTGARFVIVYSSNITADKETGIGAWSDDDFVRALHAGVRKNGQPLYPAFPYTSYTALSRDDILAIKATCLACRSRIRRRNRTNCPSRTINVGV